LSFFGETNGAVSSYRLDYFKDGVWNSYYYVRGTADLDGKLFVEKSLKAGLVLGPGTSISITSWDSSPKQPSGTLIVYLVPSN